MYNPSFHSFQGSSSSPTKEPIGEDVEELNYVEGQPDKMSEEEMQVVGANDNEGQQNEENAAAFQTKQRKKKSKIWDDMTEIKLENGIVKVQCKHCKAIFNKSASGATSHHKRHLSTCIQKKLSSTEQSRQTQQILSFSEGLTNDGITSITSFSYDHTKVRELAAHMVLAHEYLFNMMEHVVFNKFLKAVSPFYKRISRHTVKEDCISTYNIEKKKLKSLLKCANKISITTDLWKSGQKVQYMVVTAHFIDADWVLQKCVLNFCNVPPPHTGVLIADALNKCFIDWGIEDKVANITVDNAAYNDVCIRRLKEDFSLRKPLSVGGKLFHIRCCAHILNLLVQDGLSQLGDLIDVVREGIKYLNNSEAGLIEFSKIKKQFQLPSKKLILDCPTRWNSTYLMLPSAVGFKDVFPRYADIDPGFHYVPTEFEWFKVEEVCTFLGIFHEITMMISGSEYSTSNIFLVELFTLKKLLNEKMLDLHDHIRSMATSMFAKFDKYWGESNVLLSFGAILDPRYKMFLINHAFPVIYGEDAAPTYVVEIKYILYKLYSEYVDAYISSQSENEHRLVVRRKDYEGSSSFSQGNSTLIGPTRSDKQRFHKLISQIDKAPPEKSNLDIYLEEGRYACDVNANLDVLVWWKGERLKFPILSRLAADILSVPVTTVASESTFSAGGRVIVDKRSNMPVETVQMLLCGNDWIRNLHGLKNKFRETPEINETSPFQEIELPD